MAGLALIIINRRCPVLCASVHIAEEVTPTEWPTVLRASCLVFVHGLPEEPRYATAVAVTGADVE